MDQWLTAAQANPVAYQVHAIPWSSQTNYFPSMDPLVSTLPPTISDILTYSPILDMLSIFNWRLLGDRMATSDTSSEIRFFNCYLQAIKESIKSSNYPGCTDLAALLHPNPTHQFKVHGGWPIQPDFLMAFQPSHQVSAMPRSYIRVTIDVSSTTTMPPLTTTEHASIQRHSASMQNWLPLQTPC
jgi:hypothetical protein